MFSRRCLASQKVPVHMSRCSPSSAPRMTRRCTFTALMWTLILPSTWDPFLVALPVLPTPSSLIRCTAQPANYLCTGVDDIDLMQCDSVYNLLPFLQLPFRALHKPERVGVSPWTMHWDLRFGLWILRYSPGPFLCVQRWPKVRGADWC